MKAWLRWAHKGLYSKSIRIGLAITLILGVFPIRSEPVQASQVGFKMSSGCG